MNVVLFGASGMVGSGVLAECLRDETVAGVVAVVRRPLHQAHPKLTEVVVEDLFSLDAQVEELGTPDACLYCLGTASAGMTEAAYRRVTLDLTVSVANLLEQLNPNMVFSFVSGMGTSSGGPMWARVKHEAETELFGRPFSTYAFRPGVIQPVEGARPRTFSYRILYAALTPIAPLLRRLMPSAVTNTQILGRAMVKVSRDGFPRKVLETSDINQIGA